VVKATPSQLGLAKPPPCLSWGGQPPLLFLKFFIYFFFAKGVVKATPSQLGLAKPPPCLSWGGQPPLLFLKFFIYFFFALYFLKNFK
jgi:hypothetical protein